MFLLIRQAMKITYCRDKPKAFICERDEQNLPSVGAFVDLLGKRYKICRVEPVAREALIYVMPD